MIYSANESFKSIPFHSCPSWSFGTITRIHHEKIYSRNKFKNRWQQAERKLKGARGRAFRFKEKLNKLSDKMEL